MRQYRYILFKDGRPWKGLFHELDLINEYEHAFEAVLSQMEKVITSPKLAREQAILRFLRDYCPTAWSKQQYGGYKSLLRPFVIGNDSGEDSVLCAFEWKDLTFKQRALFNYYSRQHEKLMRELNNAELWETPDFGVTRGSGLLSEL